MSCQDPSAATALPGSSHFLFSPGTGPETPQITLVSSTGARALRLISLVSALVMFLGSETWVLYRMSRWPVFGRVGVEVQRAVWGGRNMASKFIQEAVSCDHVGPRAACICGTHRLDKHGDSGLLGRGATVGIGSWFPNLRAYELQKHRGQGRGWAGLVGSSWTWGRRCSFCRKSWRAGQGLQSWRAELIAQGISCEL